MVESPLDTNQKTGAVLKSEHSDLRRKDRIALEKAKELEKRFSKKMRTVDLGFCLLSTTKSKSDFESYDPLSLRNTPEI